MPWIAAPVVLADSVALFVGVNEIHEILDVVALGEASLLLA
jgi:hypothetical protein